MPPKRGRPAKSSATKHPKPAPAKRAKRTLASTAGNASHKVKHAAQSDDEIMDAFRLFAVPRGELDDADEAEEDDDDEEGVLKILDVRRCLSAVNLPKPPPDFFDDPSQTHISASDFLALAQTLRDTASVDSPLSTPSASLSPDNPRASTAVTQEINHAFSLFTHNRPGEDVRITLADLKRVAKELREDVDEPTLRLMIEEANGEQGRASVGRGVGVGEFEEVMRRAGVFS